MKTHINLEYAHIYLDEEIGEEIFEAARLASSFFKLLNENGNTVVRSVMIDDYNPVERILDENKFLKTLDEKNVLPDYLVYEADLIKYKDIVLNAVHAKLRREYIRYIELRKNVPCSLLIAIWHLIRLGAVPIENGEIKDLSGSGKAFVSDRVVSILPRRFKNVEEKANKLIKKSTYNKYLEKIERVYF